MGAAKVSFDQLPGADIALTRNPSTGKFDIQWDSTNNVLFDDTQEHAVISAILEYKAQYWGDATGTRGSYLYSVKDDRKTSPSRMQGFVLDALQPLLDTGRILPPTGQTQPTVTATRVRPGRIDIAVTYSTPQGGVVTARTALKY